MNDLSKMKALGLCLMGFVGCSAYAASVFDDAKVWWKFDQGGADGTVVTASQIHDARNVGQGVPTAVYGAQGGPLWSVLDVRLPYQRKTVRSTALHLPFATRYNSTAKTNEFYQANATFENLTVDGDEMTLVTRVRLKSEQWNNADCILWNNGFNWGNSQGSALGFIKGNPGARGPVGATGTGVTYFPYAFEGQNWFGNNTERVCALKVGEWYDVAYLYRVEVEDGKRYDVMTFVVGDASGVQTNVVRKVSKRVTGASRYNRFGTMAWIHAWTPYAQKASANSSDTFKNFDGWVHQLAIWDRTLTLDEVKEAFGKPVEGEQDVFSEAVNWYQFDRDLNGDGIVQTNEIRDVRSWNRPNDRGPLSSGAQGPKGGALWTNMNVYIPGRGVTVKSDCLYLPLATNLQENASGELIASAWPTTLFLPNSGRSGSYTVMARIYPLQQTAGGLCGNTAFFYNNCFNWGSYAGGQFGLGCSKDRTGNTFYPEFLIGHDWYRITEIPMVTNTWYDIAFSLTDNDVGTDGKNKTDTAIVAVQDATYGFRVKTLDVSTNVFTVFSTWNSPAMVGAQGTYDKLNEFRNLTTGKEISSSNPAKSYNGMIHQLVIWNRALTAEEIAAAFSHPNNMVMGVGSADGSSGEFAETGGSYDCRVDDGGVQWRNIAGTLDADHSELTLRFTPDARNLNMVHYLHVQAAAVGTDESQQAEIVLTLNGKQQGKPVLVGAYDEIWCVVPKTVLVGGENILKISYQGGSAASFALDQAEIVGSWQLGVADKNVGEFSQEGGGRGANFTIGNRNMKNVLRAVTMGWKNNYIHFYMPAELAEKHAFRFSSVMVDRSADAVVEGAIRVLLNGEEKYLSPRDAVDSRAPFTFDVEPGELKAGWNTIQPQYLHTAGWLSFDYFRFEISDYNPATFLIVR